MSPDEATPRSGDPVDVYLHVGLPRTGTSHVQQVLWLSRDQLSAGGVLVPGSTQRSQRYAVWDLMGRRLQGADEPAVAGAWPSLAADAAGWSGSHVVISEEFLTNANKRQARRAVRSLAPARVHVVVTARDLGQVVCSTWQGELAKGQTWSWDDYITAVRDLSGGPATAGAAFWLHQDLVRVLDTWEAAVPRDRIQVVTVPPPGAPRQLLMERFAAATRLDARALVTSLSGGNVSVGIAEAEVLRRLNAGLDGRLNERQRIWAVQQGIKSALRGRTASARIELPADERGWLADRATAMVEQVRSRGYPVHGDLSELVPAGPAAGQRRPDDVDEAEVAAAAMDALVAMTQQYADLRWRTRQRDDGTGSKQAGGLASRLRAQNYRARSAVLGLADRSRLVNGAVNRYLRRSARRS